MDRPDDRMDCPRLARSLPFSLSHFSCWTVFSDDDDVGRTAATFLAEWKMERPAVTTEWSVSFILFLPFQFVFTTITTSRFSLLVRVLHSLTGKERKSQPPHSMPPRSSQKHTWRHFHAHLSSLLIYLDAHEVSPLPSFNRFLCKFLFALFNT